MKYRKRPVIIEAGQYRALADNPFGAMCHVGGPPSGVTLEGAHWVDKGDWIIRGVKGEFYPCKPDIFEMTYEPADDNSAPAPTAPPAEGER